MTQQKQYTKIPIGRIEEVTDIRSVWPHEQYNFSEWLADNIEILNEAIGMNLEVTDKELHIGAFRADIVCKDDNVGKVVIENQLERTDHDHFGKIITYAAGVDAGAVVWIAPTFTEPHLTAVKWLNDETGNNRQFFAIEIHLFKIGDSAPAPYLKVVAQPNEWRKVAKSIANSDPKSQLEATRYSYWTCLSEYLQDKGYKGSLPKPARTHYNNLSVGKSQMFYALTIDSVHNIIKTMVYLEGPKARTRYDFLKEKCFEEGRKIFGEDLVWVDKEGNSTKAIEIAASYCLNDESKWKQQFEWFYQKLTGFKALFGSYIKDLD